jgi:hypothetical protein
MCAFAKTGHLTARHASMYGEIRTLVNEIARLRAKVAVEASTQISFL